MSLIGWIIIVIFSVCFVFDWIVIMGTNPKEWKGYYCYERRERPPGEERR